MKTQDATPVAVSRKLALRMNSDRRDYLAYNKQSKENRVRVFRSAQQIVLGLGGLQSRRDVRCISTYQYGFINFASTYMK